MLQEILHCVQNDKGITIRKPCKNARLFIITGIITPNTISIFYSSKYGEGVVVPYPLFALHAHG